MDIRNYHKYTTKQLDELHTGVLMNIRNATYKMAVCECCGEALTKDDKEFNLTQWVLRTKVLALLSTREHYPNKAERKVARQMAAKHGR